MRVLRASPPNGGWVDAVDTETGRETQVRTENWERRYRPFTSPVPESPPADEGGEK